MSFTPTSRIFGHLPSGERVKAYVLKGSGGLELEVITYGGIVTRLIVPDRSGDRADVVLGFDDLTSYLKSRAYFGAIVGRVAGRITNAQYTLEGKLHRLVANDSPHHLHGGTEGFDRRLWNAVTVSREDGAPSLRLTYRSFDGEEGHPGQVDVTVTYTITADNVFLIETEATADRATPFNLTHHSYFNLAGGSSGSIGQHELQIHSDTIVPCDYQMTLLGNTVAVEGTGADLRAPRLLADVIPRLFKSHGDLYLLPHVPTKSEEGSAALIPAARLTEPESGRVLEVSTTEACLQFYTGAALDGSSIGKSGVPYGRHAGLCLECENYPDGVNHPALGNIVLRPGTVRRHVTSYAFSTVLPDQKRLEHPGQR